MNAPDPTGATVDGPPDLAKALRKWIDREADPSLLPAFKRMVAEPSRPASPRQQCDDTCTADCGRCKGIRAMGPMHVGRAWHGHDIEDTCPCPQEPCGLVDPGRADPECQHHPVGRAKSIRQGHKASECPGGGWATPPDFASVPGCTCPWSNGYLRKPWTTHQPGCPASPSQQPEPVPQPDTGAQDDGDAEVVQTLLAGALANLGVAHTDNERAEAIADLLEGWYDLWPDTAVTSPHEPIAGELVRLLRVVDEAKARPLPDAVAMPDLTDEDVAEFTAAWGDRWGRTGALESAEAIAQRFHEAYERLAPSYGYRTREASAKPWAEVPERNRALMIAVAGEVAPLIEREALERAADDMDGWCDEAVERLRARAASLVGSQQDDDDPGRTGLLTKRQIAQWLRAVGSQDKTGEGE